MMPRLFNSNFAILYHGEIILSIISEALSFWLASNERY